jgi:hypothetical protein
VKRKLIVSEVIIMALAFFINVGWGFIKFEKLKKFGKKIK